jgi:hypothetical protein
MLAKHNLYFAALPTAIQEKWKPSISVVEFGKGDILSLEPDSGFLYFPMNCIAAIIVSYGDQKGAFLRFSGQTFLIGIANLSNVRHLRFEASICRSGYACRVPISIVKKYLPIRASANRLKEFTMARMLESTTISAICAISHTSSQRLARVLLEASDNFSVDDGVSLTQLDLSKIIGVRRETVATQLLNWTQKGIVSTKRSRISIERRDWLLDNSCACYSLIEKQRQEEWATWTDTVWSLDEQ